MSNITIKPVLDFLSLKGSIKTKKPFNLNAMEKAIEDNKLKAIKGVTIREP